MRKIRKIIKSGLCLGCGLCETIATSQKCQMILNGENGFYEPVFTEKLTQVETRSILKSCPGIKVQGNNESSVWGEIKQIEEAWSSDPFIRKKASSGGVITTLAIHLLETQKVNGILHVGVNDGTYLYNSLKVSKTKEDIINNMGSRYAPALVFDQLKNILNKSKDIYAFIGKPCDIAGIKNFVKEFPEYKDRINYFLAIFCAGMPSYNGTKETLKLSGHNEDPFSLKYRGDGWPGFFEAKYEKKTTFKISYNDSWGKVLGKTVGLRCKICPDGIGLLADIAVGDSWITKDGYPDFEESDGRSFAFVRTDQGLNLFNNAIRDQKIISHKLDINKIAEMQSSQYQRRLLVGYRILSIQVLTGMLLKFKGLGILNLMAKANKEKGIRNLLGTSKRFIKRHKDVDR